MHINMLYGPTYCVENRRQNWDLVVMLCNCVQVHFDVFESTSDSDLLYAEIPNTARKGKWNVFLPWHCIGIPFEQESMQNHKPFLFLPSTTAPNPSHPSLTFSTSRLVALNILTILFIFRSHIPSRHWCSHYSEHSGQHGKQIYFMSLRFIRILICCSKS